MASFCIKTTKHHTDGGLNGRNNQLGLASPRSPPVAPANMGSFSNYTAGQVMQMMMNLMVNTMMNLIVNTMSNLMMNTMMNKMKATPTTTTTSMF